MPSLLDRVTYVQSQWFWKELLFFEQLTCQPWDFLKFDQMCIPKPSFGRSFSILNHHYKPSNELVHMFSLFQDLVWNSRADSFWTRVPRECATVSIVMCTSFSALHWIMQDRLKQRYLDKVLPFGLRSTPLIFLAIADALQWIIQAQGVEFLFHYLSLTWKLCKLDFSR